MNNSHSTDTDNKTHVPDSGIGAMAGEDEYIAASASGGDIAKMASGDSPPLKPHNIIALQRKLGNQATLNIINRTAQNNTDSNTNPFAGLKMVTPGTIQREPGDGGGSDDNDNDNEDGGSSDPDEAVELDGSDDEVQQESNEIDQTISEAQQLPSTVNTPTITRSDTVDSDMDDENNVDVPAPTPVDISNEDDDDSDDDDVGYSKVNQQNMINQQQGHQQLKGTKVPGTKGHQLSSTGVWGSIGQGVVDTGRNTATTVEATEATSAIKSASSLNEALTNISDTSTDTGSDGISGILGKVGNFFDVPPMNVILPIATLIFRIMAAITKHKHMKAFKAMMSSHGGDVKTAKKSSTALKDKGAIGAYGFAKTKRGFWLRVIKAAINVGQVISRLITILSGGTAALVSEAVSTALSLSNGVIKVGQSLKGIYKMIMGKRGKRRNESANWIVDAAIDGDTEMLQFMVDGEALSKTFMVMRDKKYTDEAEVSTDKDKLAKLKILATRPKNAAEMKTYLETAEELDMLKAVKQQVSIMTKST